MKKCRKNPNQFNRSYYLLQLSRALAVAKIISYLVDEESVYCFARRFGIYIPHALETCAGEEDDCLLILNMSQPENTIEGGGDFPKDFTCCHSLSYIVSLTMICFVRYYKITNHGRIFSCDQNINKLNDARLPFILFIKFL